MSDKLTAPLQESILALLATNDRQGRVAASLLNAAQFNDSYHDFAERVIKYHKRHGKAPGQAHLDDLVDDIVGNPQHKQHRLTIRIIEGILGQAEGLNPEYLLTRISDFTDRQRLKQAITEASALYTQGEETTGDVKQLLLKALRAPAMSIDSGVFLDDKKKTLTFLDKINVDYSIGVPEFDKNNLGLATGQILLLIGSKGSGKSWACVDIGKRALMQKAKVVHYTLENPWQQTVGRYYQSFFAIPSDEGKLNITRLELDKLGRMSGRKSESLSPRITLNDAKIRRYLGKRIDDWGLRLHNLVVKEFPTGTLTIDQLEAHLEYLELAEGFIPHVMLLDYPDLMSLKGDDKRNALGDTFIALRGLLQRRKMCGFLPTQGNRSSWDASTMKASMVSEDASKVFTSDMVILYSQTPEEKALGLARLSIPYNRNGKDKFTVIISQNYATGQFVIDSARMGNNYFDVVKTSPEEPE